MAEMLAVDLEKNGCPRFSYAREEDA